MGSLAERVGDVQCQAVLFLRPSWLLYGVPSRGRLRQLVKNLGSQAYVIWHRRLVWAWLCFGAMGVGGVVKLGRDLGRRRRIERRDPHLMKQVWGASIGSKTRGRHCIASAVRWESGDATCVE